MKRKTKQRLSTVIGWAAVALAVLGTATTRYGYVKGYEDGSRSMREAFEAQEKYANRIARASRHPSRKAL